MDLVILIAPPGTDEASHGTVRYRVGLDGRIAVPREAVPHLTRNAGFVLAPEKDRDGATTIPIPAKESSGT